MARIRTVNTGLKVIVEVGVAVAGVRLAASRSIYINLSNRFQICQFSPFLVDKIPLVFGEIIKPCRRLGSRLNQGELRDG